MLISMLGFMEMLTALQKDKQLCLLNRIYIVSMSLKFCIRLALVTKSFHAEFEL